MLDWVPLPKPSDEEIEAQRQGALAKKCSDSDSEFSDVTSFVEHHKPGTFGAHEALHTASLVMDLHERHVLSHPSVLSDPLAYRLASRAEDLLFDLYQYLGAAHLGRDEDGAP